MKVETSVVVRLTDAFAVVAKFSSSIFFNSSCTILHVVHFTNSVPFVSTSAQ